jgi:hypothetical protein
MPSSFPPDVARAGFATEGLACDVEGDLAGVHPHRTRPHAGPLEFNNPTQISSERKHAIVPVADKGKGKQLRWLWRVTTRTVVSRR